MSSTQASVKLWHLVQSQRVTAVIYVAAKLGDRLNSCAMDRGPFVELAAATGANKQALGRLLTALSTIGICTIAEERYAFDRNGRLS